MNNHGGRRKGSGRSKTERKQRTVYLSDRSWKLIQQKVKQHKASGAKGISASSLIDLLIVMTVHVYD